MSPHKGMSKKQAEKAAEAARAWFLILGLVILVVGLLGSCIIRAH